GRRPRAQALPVSFRTLGSSDAAKSPALPFPEQEPASELTPPVSPRAPWRLARLEALPGFRLRVQFNDGVEGTVYLGALVHSASAGIFAALRDENLFRQARIELGAATWPANLDLAPDAMHRAIKEYGTWIVQ